MFSCLAVKALVSALCARTSVRLVWVKGHCGIPGNERADKAAKPALTSFSSIVPIIGQPRIPLSVSKSLCRLRLKSRWQQRWLRELIPHYGLDSLCRLRVSVDRWSVVPLGSRPAQTTLARLRIGHCRLNFRLSRFDSDISPLCACGLSESVSHFLLICPLHSVHRERMFSTVATVFRGVINEDILLGSAAVPRDASALTIIVHAVYDFVKACGRRI